MEQVEALQVVVLVAWACAAVARDVGGGDAVCGEDVVVCMRNFRWLFATRCLIPSHFRLDRADALVADVCATVASSISMAFERMQADATAAAFSKVVIHIPERELSPP